MNRRLLLILGLVAAIVALLIWFLRGPRGGAHRATTPVGAAASAASSTASGTPSAAAGHALPDPRRLARGSIAGTVTERGGGPLAGARVCTSWSAEGATTDDTREPICVTTDAAGAYQLAALVPGFHQVSAFTAGHLPASWRDPERNRDGVELAAGQVRTGIDLVLATGGGELSGVVEDVSGGPVADALVSATPGTGWWSRGATAIARSDAQGHFTLWTKPGPVSLSATAEGYARGKTDVVAPSTKALVLLTPESVLAGTVVEAGSRTPVEGALVSVGDDWPGGDDSSDASARTDAQGRFRIARLRPGRYKPTAAAQGRYGEPAESVLLGLGQTVDDLVIEVHGAATVRGRIVIEDNGQRRPCADGWVGLQDRRGGRWEGDSADADGNIEVTALLPGHYELEVSCDGYLGQDRYDPLEVTTADIDGVVWRVGAGGRIRGVVKTAAGTPVADANVAAETIGGAARAQRSWGNDQTRADGTFLLRGLVAGDYTLEVSADDERPPEPAPTVTVPANGEATVEVVLPAGGTIAGTVADTEGAPVRGARVRVANAGWEWGASEARTGDDGSFAIKGVKPGARRVVATRGWFDEMRRPGSSDDDVQGERVTVVAGKTTTVRLVVEARSGVIRGTVRDEQGEPVVDAWVTTSRASDAAGALADGAARATRWQWGQDDRPVMTGTDGSFTVRDLTPGTYAVRAFRRGGGEAVAEHVKVGTSVALVIRATGSIAGTVTVTDGPPPDGLSISVVDERAGVRRSETFFRTAGTFALRDLPAGTFLVTADAAGGRAMTTVTLTAGERKTGVTLVLERNVTVRGRMVELGTGTPAPGLSVSISPAKGASGMQLGDGDGDKKNISGEDGRFEVAHAATGQVWVMALPLDVAHAPWGFSRTFKVVAGGQAVVDVGDVQILRKRKEMDEPDGDLGFTFADEPPGTDPEASELKVALIRAGGPAARSGLQVGDVIVSVDGIDVRGALSARGWVLFSVLEGTRVSLGVERGATIEITAGPPL